MLSKTSPVANLYVPKYTISLHRSCEIIVRDFRVPIFELCENIPQCTISSSTKTKHCVKGTLSYDRFWTNCTCTFRSTISGEMLLHGPTSDKEIAVMFVTSPSQS